MKFKFRHSCTWFSESRDIHVHPKPTAKTSWSFWLVLYSFSGPYPHLSLASQSRNQDTPPSALSGADYYCKFCCQKLSAGLHGQIVPQDTDRSLNSGQLPAITMRIPYWFCNSPFRVYPYINKTQIQRQFCKWRRMWTLKEGREKKKVEKSSGDRSCGGSAQPALPRC